MAFRLRGMQRIQNKLQGQLFADTAMMEATNRAGLLVKKRLETYPRQRSGTLYARTGTLGRRWTLNTSRRGLGYVAVVSNPTSYGPFVQADRFQAGVHRGLWHTDKDVLEEQLPKIRQIFEGALGDMARKFNRG